MRLLDELVFLDELIQAWVRLAESYSRNHRDACRFKVHTSSDKQGTIVIHQAGVLLLSVAAYVSNVVYSVTAADAGDSLLRVDITKTIHPHKRAVYVTLSIFRENYEKLLSKWDDNKFHSIEELVEWLKEEINKCHDEPLQE